MSGPDTASALAVDPDEVVEIEGPVSAAALQRSEPLATVDPVEYASMLKEKLDLYCAAVAFSRSSSADPQSYVSIADTSLLSSDSLRYQSQASTNDDIELDKEVEALETIEVAQVKRVKRMLSNRESARRSRRRKQTHVNELEEQVSQLRVENSVLLNRFTNMNQKYNEVVANRKILEAAVETLSARVVHHLTPYVYMLLVCLIRLCKPYKKGAYITSNYANFFVSGAREVPITLTQQSEAMSWS